ncbi:DnaJ domain-containing protein [Candidatus Poribacteria bacterium]
MGYAKGRTTGLWNMITRKIINLLEEEDIELSADAQPEYIDDTFVPRFRDNDAPASEPGATGKLSTATKLHILEWASMERQLRSYGFNKLDDLSLELISENIKKHIKNGNSNGAFDFRSDSIPFAVKYNIAIAMSCSEAIGILSSPDGCEIYASAEVDRIFKEYGRHIMPGLNRISFDEFPLDMKRDLVWPMVQNLYRALTIRKASQAFPEGVSGKLAHEALTAECENERLASQLSHLDALKYSDYETVYFSDPSDLEMKYHVAVYCLNHIGEIKPKQTPETPPEEDELTHEDEQQHAENVKKLEEEYIAAFRRIDKNKAFWDKINLEDIFEMGKDVVEAIKEEVKNFAQLKQGIISRLSGRSEVAIENEELLRIAQGQNPDFGFASQYMAMFFQPSDYYSILGLDSIKGATERDVKDAFKRQAKIYHPDKNSDDPNKDDKEKRFKLLIAAKDALLRRMKSGKEAPADFRDDVSLTNYLGNMSVLFGEYSPAYHNVHRRQEKVAELEDINQHGEDAEPAQNIRQEETTSVEDIYQGEEGYGMEIEDDITEEPAWEPEQEPTDDENYVGPYFAEMRILESMIDGWAGKVVLVMGAGRDPEEFSIPVILAQMGASVSAVDINYRGPAEYQGCQYYRVSADRVNEMFAEGQFDIIISTAMFGVPFTNWAVREFSLNSFDEGLKDRIRDLELEVLGKLFILTKDSGIHFHHNKDLNPQSWNFSEDDLKQIGYESAFHPDGLPNPREMWVLRR